MLHECSLKVIVGNGINNKMLHELSSLTTPYGVVDITSQQFWYLLCAKGMGKSMSQYEGTKNWEIAWHFWNAKIVVNTTYKWKREELLHKESGVILCNGVCE